MSIYQLSIINEGVESTSLHQLVSELFEMTRQVSSSLEIPDFRVQVIPSSTFDESVQTRLHGSPFDSERIGGQVQGKTLPEDPSYETSNVIVRIKPEEERLEEGLRIVHPWTISHEFAHVMLGRLRGTADYGDISIKSTPLGGDAGDIALGAIDELRCNLYAHALLQMLLSQLTDDESKSFIDGFLMDMYRPELQSAVSDHIYPAWPDLVNSYRSYSISLDTMARMLVCSTDSAFKLMAHAESVALLTGADSPSQTITHPGMQYYLEPAWRQIIAAANDMRTIPSIHEIVEFDQRIIHAGISGITAMWEQLGVTSRFMPDGNVWIEVCEPITL